METFPGTTQADVVGKARLRSVFFSLSFLSFGNITVKMGYEQQWGPEISAMLKLSGGLTIVPTAAQKCVAFTLWSLEKQKEMNWP